jgi:hypothetical protein
MHVPIGLDGRIQICKPDAALFRTALDRMPLLFGAFLVVPTICRLLGRITEKISLTSTVLPPPFSRKRTEAADG